MAQFYRSKRVIKMPIETFHNLASKIGDPGIPVIGQQAQVDVAP